MYNEVELLTLAGGIGVLIFIFWNKIILKLVPNAVLLLLSYGCFLLAWMLTVIESFFMPELSNVAEHAMYAVGSILLCIWCYRAFSKEANHG